MIEQKRETFEASLPDSPEAAKRASGESFDLRGYQDAVDRYIREFGVRYFSELTNLAQLMEEVGEVARVLSRTAGEQSAKETDLHPDLADELADVLFVLTCLANQSGIDLTRAAARNLEKKRRRDRRRHLNNPKLRKEQPL